MAAKPSGTRTHTSAAIAIAETARTKRTIFVKRNRAGSDGENSGIWRYSGDQRAGAEKKRPSIFACAAVSASANSGGCAPREIEYFATATTMMIPSYARSGKASSG